MSPLKSNLEFSCGFLFSRDRDEPGCPSKVNAISPTVIHLLLVKGTNQIMDAVSILYIGDIYLITWDRISGDMQELIYPWVCCG